MNDFYDIVKGILPSAAEKFQEEKITEDIVEHMTDEDLSCYLPRHGDRLRLRTKLHQQKGPQQRKRRLLSVLQKKLEESNKKSFVELEENLSSDMRTPHRPYGNRNAAKDTRLIELGWIHKVGNRTFQVRKNKGGGTRKTEILKTAKKADIIEEAKKLFFPDGYSLKGPIENFKLDLWDFADRPINEDLTVVELYDITKMPLMRVYLATSLRNDEPAQGRSNLTENDRPQEQTVAGTDEDIVAQAMGIVGLPTDNFQEVNDDYLNSPTVVSPNSFDLKLHRGHLMRELIDEFRNINPFQDSVKIQLILPDGSAEAAEDNGGVTRDTLAEFWNTFWCTCTTGTKYKIPFLRHDFGEKEWESVAKIIVYGWRAFGYFPVLLSVPFVQMSVFGKISVSIIDAFLEFLPEEEAATFRKALSVFEEVEQDELLDLLDLHDCKTLPTKDNFQRLLSEIAHKEIIQTPMFVVDCWKPILDSIGISEEQLGDLYRNLIPTSRAVIKLFQFPATMTIEEQTVSNHLRRFVREMNQDLLSKFVRFCTGSDLMITKEISVAFVGITGLARRPVAHTCSCLLELPKSYENYPQFRSEFLSVLESNVWVMDII